MKTFLRTLVASCSLVLAASPLFAGKISDDLGEESLVFYKNGLQPYDASTLNDVKYFAIYYSAKWCPPCRAFTPELVEFYNRAKKKHPDFEVIFVSSDKDEGEMANYMRDYRMRFPALKYKQRGVITQHHGRGIPNLIFVDADNNVIKGSYEGDNYLGPRVVLEEIRKRLSAEAKETAKTNDVNPFQKKEVNVFGQ